MTDCADVGMRDLLPDFLRGSLEADARAAVAAHLRGCAACTDELALLRRARAVMQRAPRVDVGRIVAVLPRPAAAARPELTLIDGGDRVPARVAGRTARWAPTAIAASLLVAAGLTGLGVLRFTDVRRPASTSSAAATASVPDPAGQGGVTGSAQPDGSTLVVVSPGPDAPAAPPAAVVTDTDGAAPSALLAVNVATMSDAQIEGLLAELDELDALPSLEPRSLMTIPDDPDPGSGD